MIDSADELLAASGVRYHTPVLRTKVQISERVTVFHAAAGFGKTYAMIAASEQLRREGAFVAWLSCSALALPDGDFLAAVRRFFELFEGADAVFIDVLEVLSREQRMALLHAFDRMPPSCRIVLAVRSLEELGLPRLIADGAVQLVSADVLRWRRRHLSELWQHRLTAHHLNFIDTLAEGWPAVSQLLARFLLEGGDPSEETVFSNAVLVAAYIREEVLAAFDPYELPLLAMTSLVDGFDDALIQRLDAASALSCDALVRRLPGLCAYGSDGRLAVNRALSLYLRKVFAGLSLQSRTEALRGTADWASTQGDVVLAGKLAAEAGDRERIVDYIGKAGGLKIWIARGHNDLRAVVETAGEAMVAREPNFKLLKCAVLAKDGQIKEAVRLYQEAALALPPDPDTQRGAACLRLSLMLYGCQLAALSDAEIQVAARLLDQDPVYREIVPTILAIMHIQQADFGAAAAEISVARAYGHAAGASYNLMFLDSHSATMALAKGDLDEARKLLSLARLRWRKEFPADRGFETVMLSLAAQLAFEGGKIRQARQLVSQVGHRLAHSEAWLNIYFAGYEPMFRLVTREEGLAVSLAAIERARGQLLDVGLDRIAAGLSNLGLCLIGEEILRGGEGLKMPGATVSPDGIAESWQERELRLLATAYRELVEGHPDDSRQILNGLISVAEKCGLARTRLRALLLRQVAHDRLGDAGAAANDFLAALEIGARTGMRQAFAEFGSETVKSRLAAGVPAALAAFAKGLDSLMAAPSSIGAESVLTRRESQILDLLAQEDSDKAIARKLVVTEHAVRFHLKNIYKKLGVHDRHAAIKLHLSK